MASGEDPMGPVPVPTADAEFAHFAAMSRRPLERALVARYGIDVGLEAVADALAWAAEHWDRLSSVENRLGYLCRVGQSAARRHHRRRRPDVIVADPVAAPGLPFDADLQRALMRLSHEQRVAVVLVHGYGYRYRDAAEILGIPDVSVTNHVNRGLARLRTLLEP